MTLWNQRHSEIDPSVVDAIIADVGGSVTSTGYQMTFSSQAKGVEALKLTLGCFLLGSLPSAGLDEALTSLQDIWEYHRTQLALPHVPFQGTVSVSRVVSESGRLPLRLNDE